MLKTSLNEATTLRNSDLENDIILADKAGFDYIEIWLRKVLPYLEGHSIKDLKNLFAERHIRAWALDSFEDSFFRDKAGHEALKEELKGACEICAELGIDRTVIVPTVRKGINEEYTREQIDEETINVMNDLIQIARPYGVKLALEPIGFECCMIRSIKHAAELVVRMDMDDIGVTLDVFNNYLYDSLKDMDDVFKIPKGKIFIYHIDDANVMDLNKYALDHSDRICPGDGDLPVIKMTKKVLECGYDAPISVELFNYSLYAKKPVETIDIVYRATKRITDAF